MWIFWVTFRCRYMTLHCITATYYTTLYPSWHHSALRLHDLYVCLNIFTFALQYSSPCLSCTCHSCNSSFLLVTFLAGYAIWEHLGEVRRSNILAMVLGDSWLVYALCVRVSVQWSDGGSFDVILGWLSGVPCFGLRSSCVLWMTRLKKGVKSKRLIQGHYRWRRPRAACQKGSCVFGKYVAEVDPA